MFFQAGVDVLKEDRLGRMSLTSAGVQHRNKLVFEFAEDSNLPMVISMGGGYPRTKDWTPIIDAHANVYFQAHQFLMKIAATRQAEDANMQ
jgi:acetoin utilization deacetylase AcuC-like enzyme